MNAIVQYMQEERAYVAANQDRKETELARDPLKRVDALRAAADMARSDLFALALSTQDDAELGRIVREAFWRSAAEMAEDALVDEYIAGEQT